MKKLLIVFLLSCTGIVFAQENDTEIKRELAVTIKIEQDSVIISFSKGEFKNSYKLYIDDERSKFKTELIKKYADINETVEVEIEKPFIIIDIQDTKTALTASYNLNDSKKLKEFEILLVKLYTPKEVTISALNQRLKLIEEEIEHSEVIGALEFYGQNELDIHQIEYTKGTSRNTYSSTRDTINLATIIFSKTQEKNKESHINTKIITAIEKNNLKLSNETSVIKDLDTIAAILFLLKNHEDYESLKKTNFITITTQPDGNIEIKFDSVSTKKVKLKSVSLEIKNGAIYEVSVRGEDGEFFRGFDYPIHIERITKLKRVSARKNTERKNKQDSTINRKYKKSLYKLKNEENDTLYIYLKDILRYIPKVGKHFIPKDTIIDIDIKKGNQKIQIRKDVYLNSYIEAAIYTDMFSLLNEEPNGQLQTEFSANINLNTINIRDYYGYFFAYVQPRVKYSTFKDDVKRLDLDQPNINNSDILQRSYLDLGLKLNLFKGELGNRMGIDVSSGINYSYTRAMKDSIQDDLNLFETYGEIRFHLKEYHNFGITAGIKASYTNGPKSSFDLSDNDNFKHNWFIEPEVEIYYYPIKEKENQIFIRFQYVGNTRDHTNDFSTFQFGYKIPINLKQK